MCVRVHYACVIIAWPYTHTHTHYTSYKPFRIVTLASSGSEGGADIGAMRLAQTAGYGVLPAPAGTGMENTFLAQAFDTGEKRSFLRHCYSKNRTFAKTGSG